MGMGSGCMLKDVCIEEVPYGLTPSVGDDVVESPKDAGGDNRRQMDADQVDSA